MTILNTILLDLCNSLATLYPDHETQIQHAWWILEHATGLSHAQLLCTKNVSDDIQKKIDHILVEHVEHHKPLAYIIGSIPFCSATILVESPLLIPRMETEEWVDCLIDQLIPVQKELTRPLAILDLCSGSGCIAVALARALPEAFITAIDIEPQSIELIKKNIIHNNVLTITPIQSDLFAALNSDHQFDIIVSNPPYITPDEYQNLEASVKEWEDPKALFAEDDGLMIIKKIITEAPYYMRSNDILYKHNIPQLLIEIGHTQGTLAKDLMNNAGYSNITIQKDCAGKDRVVTGSRAYEEQRKTR